MSSNIPFKVKELTIIIQTNNKSIHNKKKYSERATHKLLMNINHKPTEKKTTSTTYDNNKPAFLAKHVISNKAYTITNTISSNYQ